MKRYKISMSGTIYGLQTIEASRLGVALGKIFPKRYRHEGRDTELKKGEKITFTVERL